MSRVCGETDTVGLLWTQFVFGHPRVESIPRGRRLLVRCNAPGEPFAARLPARTRGVRRGQPRSDPIELRASEPLSLILLT